MLDILRDIPRGKVITYKELAKRLNLHPRAVGKLLNKNKDKSIPCYKVINSSGRIGGYNRGIKEKIKLLRRDSIKIKGDKVVNFEDIIYLF